MGKGKNRLLFFLIAFLFIFIVLALRKPDALLNPQLYGDDGFIFLRKSLFRSLSETIWLTHTQYLHIFPFIVASLFNIYNFYAAPFVFNMIGLAVNALSIVLLLLNCCEKILPLRFRLAAIGILCALPWHTETYSWMSAAHYYLFIILALLSLADLNSLGWAGKTTAFVLMVTTVFSSPNVILLVPVWIFIFFRQFKHRNFMFYFALIGLFLTVIVSAMILTTTLDKSSSVVEPKLMLFPEFMAKSIGIKIAANNLIGQEYAGRMSQVPLEIWGVSVAFLIVLIVFFFSIQK